MNIDGNNRSAIIDMDKLSNFFSIDSNVICALLFGSSQDGTVRIDSDLDIGVLFHSPPGGRKLLDYYSKICDELPEVNMIDLVVLNEANEILAFEVLKGRYLCRNDMDAIANFFSMTCLMYEEAMAFAADHRII